MTLDTARSQCYGCGMSEITLIPVESDNHPPSVTRMYARLLDLWMPIGQIRIATDVEYSEPKQR